ncbi:HupE/UreJ family protein [Endothiovibrio diazotrophicus]
MLWLLPLAASAHKLVPAVVEVQLAPGGNAAVAMTLNLEALLAGIRPLHADTDQAPERVRYDTLRGASPQALEEVLRGRLGDLLAGIEFRFGQRRVAPEFRSVEIPPVGDIRVARKSTLHFSLPVPPGAEGFRFRLDPRFGNCVLRLSTPERGEPVAHWLTDGEASPPFAVDAPYREMSRLRTLGRYLPLGFTHILPLGLDHILFVLGLFLLTIHLRPVLWQVTAFTVAHTITLALTVLGYLSLPSTVVEPLIAASIVYIGAENVVTRTVHWHRVIVIFLFGLLHGMGFAGVLREGGIPPGQFVSALISFNVGVELGQLTVIAIAFAAVGYWFRERPWYRRRVVIPFSLVIAAVGLYWTVTRIG